jgi:hypothetical protein
VLLSQSLGELARLLTQRAHIDDRHSGLNKLKAIVTQNKSQQNVSHSCVVVVGSASLK